MRDVSNAEQALFEKYISQKAQRKLLNLFKNLKKKKMLWAYYLKMRSIEAGLFIDFFEFSHSDVEVRRGHFQYASQTAKIFLDNLAFIDGVISIEESTYLRKRFDSAILGGDSIRSIYFEMQVFAQVFSENRNVKFGEAIGKKADIYAEINGEEFNIECKSLRNEMDYDNAALHLHQILQMLCDRYDKVIVSSQNYLAIELKSLLTLKDPVWQRRAAASIAGLYSDSLTSPIEGMALIFAEPSDTLLSEFGDVSYKRYESISGPIETDNIYIHVMVQSIEKRDNMAIFFLRTQPTGLRERVVNVACKAATQTIGSINPVLALNLESSNFYSWPANYDVRKGALANAEICWDEFRNCHYTKRFAWIGICNNFPPENTNKRDVLHDPLHLDFRRASHLDEPVSATPFINPTPRFFA